MNLLLSLAITCLATGLNPSSEDIHFAAINGELDAVKRLITDNHELLEARDENGCTPLHYAAQGGYADIVRLLLEHGADVDVMTEPNRLTPLHVTSEPAVVEELLRFKPDLAIRSHGETPLQYAASKVSWGIQHGFERKRISQLREIVKLLLDAGADYDIMTAIHLGDEKRVDEVLANDPVRAKEKRDNREVPLRLAARLGREQIVRMLLDHGADPDNYAYSGWRLGKGGVLPILCEAMEHPHIVEMLLQAGATFTKPISFHGGGTGISAVNSTRATMVHYAAASGVLESAKLLIDRDVDIDARDADGLTPLHVAAQWGNVEMAHFLLERGANTHLKDGMGNTALHYAAAEGVVALAQVLLERGLDVNAQEAEGQTPLHLAAERHRLEMVRFLLDRGADPTLKDRMGRTALAIAEGTYQSEKLIQTLRNAMERGR